MNQPQTGNTRTASQQPQAPRAATKTVPIDFQELNEMALPYLPIVLEELLELDIKQVGQEIQMLNPLRQDSDFGSFSVNSETGAWADFAEDEKKRPEVATSSAWWPSSSRQKIK